MHIYKAMAKLY